MHPAQQWRLADNIPELALDPISDSNVGMENATYFGFRRLTLNLFSPTAPW